MVFDREQIKINRAHDSLVCYEDVAEFDWAATLLERRCEYYQRSRLNLSPEGHLDMRALDETRESLQRQETAQKSQRRESRLLAIGTAVLTIAAIIVAALIGRGLIFG